MAFEHLKDRTKQLGIRAMKMVEFLPKTRAAQNIEGQIVRCSTSVGANYRAACRAQSLRDFIKKLKIAEEECDETAYWLEVILESDMMPIDSPQKTATEEMKIEAEKLVAILVKSIKTSRQKLKDQENSKK
jgi:four helix bundle protein